MVSLFDSGKNLVMTSSHSVKLKMPKDWKCTSTPFLSLNMPMVCFKMGVLVPLTKYSFSKGTAV